MKLFWRESGSDSKHPSASASMETLEIGCHALEGEPAALVRVFCAINRANEYIPSIGGWRIMTVLCDDSADEGFGREIQNVLKFLPLFFSIFFLSFFNLRNFAKPIIIHIFTC